MDPTQLQQLGLTEDQIAALMQMGVLSGEESNIEEQLAQAQQLRNRPGPRGRFSGRAYTKAHPLEHLASGINQVRGGIEANQAMEKRKANLEEQARLRQQFMAAYLKNRKNPPGATIAPGQIPPGGIAPQQQPTAGGMFPMPAGGMPYGATATPGMLRR